MNLKPRSDAVLLNISLMKRTLFAKCGIAYQSMVVPVAVEAASVPLDDSSLIPSNPK